MQVRFYCRKMLLVETRISKFHRNGTAVVIINKNFAKQNLDHQLFCTCFARYTYWFISRPSARKQQCESVQILCSLEHVKYDNEFFMFPISFQDSTGD